MNKTQLIEGIADATGLTRADAGKAVDALGTIVGDALAEGQAVTLTGIGKLVTKHRKARVGRNPSTGAEIQIAAKDVVSFKAAKALTDQVNA